MDRATYCIEVCGGKCCTLHYPGEFSVRCPKQASDGSCSVYKDRYGGENPAPLVVVGQWKTSRLRTIDGEPVVMPFYCGRIEDIIAAGVLHPEVAAKCCYAHPELLNKTGAESDEI
jgi:hypothetical protein